MKRKKPKVLHVYSSLSAGGGAEKLAYIFAKEHDKSEIDLSFLCLGRRGYFARRIEELGVPVFAFGLESVRSFWRLPFLLTSLLKKYDSDIVHTNLLEVDFWVRACLIAQRKIKCVRTIHSTHTLMKSSFIQLTRLQKLFYTMNLVLDRFSKRIIFISNEVKKSFPGYSGDNSKRYAVIYNCFDQDELIPRRCSDEIRRELNIGEKHFPIFSIIGRLDEQKGHAVLFGALSRLESELPDFKLLIIGDGPLRETLVETAKALEIDQHLIFLGRRTDIAGFLRLTDVYLQPSISEGLGMSAIEAMAMAKPVIVSNSGGLLELVEDGRNGLLFENRNPEDLAEKIRVLVKNKELRSTLAGNAKKHAFQKFSSRIYAQKLTRLYTDIMME